MSTPNIIIETLERENRETDLARPFHPDDNEVIIKSDDPDHPLHLPLAEVCCVLFRTQPEWAPSRHEKTKLEEIEISSGTKFNVSVPENQNFQTGFFAFLLDEKKAHRYIFFSFIGVRSRRLYTQIGEILEGSGAVSQENVSAALKDQKLAKERRFGDYVTEHHNVPQQTIEKTLREMLKGKKVPPRAKIGDILVSAGLITTTQVEETLAIQRKNKNKQLGELLIDRGLVTEDQILVALATKFRLRFIDLNEVTPTPEAINAISRDIAKQLHVLPIKEENGLLVIATADPADHAAIGDALRFHAHRRVELVVASSHQIAAKIDQFFTKEEDQVNDIIGAAWEEEVQIEEEVEDSSIRESDSKIIRLLNKILVEGYKANASDIHIEPGSGRDPVLIRYRTDGICRIAHTIPKIYSKALISRVKILSNLDIAEHRRPQSGKIIIRYENKKIEYRIEITPTIEGQEDAVLRILSSAKPLPLDKMDFSQANYDNFLSIITQPYGLILCVGPTGSGKTTTLHSALGHVNSPERKIWTAEDPVEITQQGLRQVQVNSKIGFSFADALRSFLRADPDVIMIGEMRDKETAKTALEASLTGHLVLSTLHTNTAPETVVRLIEMGLDPLHFADVFLGVLAQRLARRLCSDCRQPYKPEQEEFDKLTRTYDPEFYSLHQMPRNLKDIKLFREIGCSKCGESGYSGRVAVHELLVGTPNVKNAIRRNLRGDEIRQVAIEDGMRTLSMDGVSKVLRGYTSLEMLSRVVAG